MATDTVTATYWEVEHYVEGEWWRWDESPWMTVAALIMEKAKADHPGVPFRMTLRGRA